jgi:exosortase A
MRVATLANRDRVLALLIGLMVVPVALYWSTFLNMSAIWSTEPFRHGYMIPFISLILLWRERRRLESVTLTGSWVGLLSLVGLVLLWLVAEATSVQVIEHLSATLMISAFVLAAGGRAAFRIVWFPVAFLIFAVPMGVSIVPDLMNSTASISIAALQLMGVPVLREGMLVTTPSGAFEIVEACSGFNYLTAGTAMGVLVAHLMFRSYLRQISYVVMVVAVFIVANGIRAFIVMLVATKSEMRIFVGDDHLFLGWVLFLLAMVLMYWLAEKYSDIRREPSHARE